MINDPKRVLIVDDDPNICRVIKKVLNKQGYYTEEVGNADDAWKMIRKGIYDLVLLDLMMPGTFPKDIIQWTKIRREKDPDFKDTKIIIVTGITISQTEKEELIDGETVVDWIEKPFDTEALRKKISEIVS